MVVERDSMLRKDRQGTRRRRRCTKLGQQLGCALVSERTPAPLAVALRATQPVEELQCGDGAGPPRASSAARESTDVHVALHEVGHSQGHDLDLLRLCEL